MARKNKKSTVQKIAPKAPIAPIEETQTSAAQITALNRVLSDHPANGITPAMLKNILRRLNPEIFRHSMTCIAILRKIQPLARQ